MQSIVKGNRSDRSPAVRQGRPSATTVALTAGNGRIAAAVRDAAFVLAFATALAAACATRALAFSAPSHGDIEGTRIKGSVTDELRCLALNIYFEARGEADEGQRAVGHVVMNRVGSPRFPNTVCEVVQQGAADRLYHCQFTWWCDGLSNRPLEIDAWKSSMRLAFSVYVGKSKDPTGGALWYHADYVRPIWRTDLKRNCKIGTHIFYAFNAEAKAAWARPDGLNETASAVQVAELSEALILDPID